MKRIAKDRRIWVATVVVLSVLSLGLILDVAVTRTPPVGAPQGGHDQFDALFSAGVRSLREGRAAQAVGYLRRAHRIRPLVPEVQVNLGYAYLKLKDYAAAERSFRTAIGLRREQVNAYFGWAESLEALGDLEGALGAMRTYIHLAPDADPFKTRAMAAVWEWREALRVKRAGLAEQASQDRLLSTDGQAQSNGRNGDWAMPGSKGPAR